jgi:integrase
MGYWSGMRKGEITGLTWEKVDTKGRMIRLEGKDTKEGQAKSIPMAQAVYDVLSRIVRGLPHVNVFLYYGKPITRHAIRDMNERYDVISDRDKADAMVKLSSYRDGLRQQDKAGMLANR